MFAIIFPGLALIPFAFRAPAFASIFFNLKVHL